MSAMISTLVLLPLKENTIDSVKCGGAILKEKSGDKNHCEFSPISFKPLSEGEYYLIVRYLNGETSVHSLGKQASKQKIKTDGKQIDCALIICDFESKKTSIAFGSTNKTKVNIRELIDYYAQNCKKSEENGGKKEAGEFEKDEKDNAEKNLTSSKSQEKILEEKGEEYDDEAVAEKNYFEYTSKNERDIKENSNEQIRDEINGFDDCKKGQDQTQEICDDTSGHEDEKCDLFDNFEGEYYCKIKEKLQPLFEKYPSIDSLTALIPESKWVKVPYSKNQFYIVGLISSKRKVKYVAYGVEGFKNLTPKGFERYSTFIPESIFNPNGAGYWCVFQCAESGKQILPE